MASDAFVKVNCTYCAEEISGLRVRCVTCEFDLCLQCFSAGAEIGTHENNHPYQFVDAGTVEVVAPNRARWSAREDLQLIVGIEEYGVDKWEEISEHIKMRTAEDAQDEYFKRFLDGNIGHVTWKRAYEKRDQLVDLSKDEPSPPPVSPVLPPLDVTPEEASLLGNIPRRDDFEKEYDNEAEGLLTPLLTDNTMNADDDLDVALTLAHCDMYTQRLRERFRRKRICRDYHLVSQFYSNRKAKLPKRLTGEQEVEEKLRWLCQLQTAQEHDCLIKNIQRQRDLQQRLSELLRYRRNGVTRIEELPHFDQEFRTSKGSSDSSSHISLTVTVEGESEKNGGSDSFSTTRSSTPPTDSRSSSPRTEPEPPPLQQQQLQWTESHPVLIEPSRHLLSKTEAQLCANLDLSPSQFISIKTLLLTMRACEHLGHLINIES